LHPKHLQRIPMSYALLVFLAAPDRNNSTEPDAIKTVGRFGAALCLIEVVTLSALWVCCGECPIHHSSARPSSSNGRIRLSIIFIFRLQSSSTLQQKPASRATLQ
jgi:hypothetical protein